MACILWSGTSAGETSLVLYVVVSFNENIQSQRSLHSFTREVSREILDKNIGNRRLWKLSMFEPEISLTYLHSWPCKRSVIATSFTLCLKIIDSIHQLILSAQCVSWMDGLSVSQCGYKVLRYLAICPQHNFFCERTPLQGHLCRNIPACILYENGLEDCNCRSLHLSSHGINW